MLYKEIEKKLTEKEKWVLRRQLGIPTNLRLFVLACMDERLPIKQALGLQVGDAHIFRNAGGLVTDDALRSAMLSTQFAGTKEIIVINHTDCGMMSTSGQYLADKLAERGIDIEKVSINPMLPELKLENQKTSFSKWLGMFDDIDTACQEQVGILRNSPFIPKDVSVNGYIWEVESATLRKPNARLSEKVNTAKQMDGIQVCAVCTCLHKPEAICQCKK